MRKVKIEFGREDVVAALRSYFGIEGRLLDWKVCPGRQLLGGGGFLVYEDSRILAGEVPSPPKVEDVEKRKRLAAGLRRVMGFGSVDSLIPKKEEAVVVKKEPEPKKKEEPVRVAPKYVNRRVEVSDE